MKPMFHPPPPPPPAATELTDAPQLQVEVNNLQLENGILQEQLARQQADINTVKVQLCSMRDDRDRFKKKVFDYGYFILAFLQNLILINPILIIDLKQIIFKTVKWIFFSYR